MSGVNVDENEAWRVRSIAAAIGYLRGNKEVSTPLQFVRFEPYVLLKTSLTGDSTERVDTRVLQVISGFERGNLPIYVGQQMNVYVDSPEASRIPRTSKQYDENQMAEKKARASFCRVLMYFAPLREDENAKPYEACIGR